MDYLRSFSVSAAGMAVERARVEAASLNLAQAHAVQAPGQPGFQPVRVITSSGPDFAAIVDGGMSAVPLPMATIEPTGASPRMVHDPGHPLADAHGFVAYPGVDPANEMVSLMAATRAYEANVAAMNTARTLALKSLDIGRTP